MVSEDGVHLFERSVGGLGQQEVHHGGTERTDDAEDDKRSEKVERIWSRDDGEQLADHGCEAPVGGGGDRNALTAETHWEDLRADCPHDGPPAEGKADDKNAGKDDDEDANGLGFVGNRREAGDDKVSDSHTQARSHHQRDASEAVNDGKGDVRGEVVHDVNGECAVERDSGREESAEHSWSEEHNGVDTRQLLEHLQSCT
mmetsp:Transcript_9134/g.16461  ORF Transcript_9134/g.16461 Transcript_9134/m.16461 type:complete len:201 (+) Transcript_9134:399-1001(+)